MTIMLWLLIRASTRKDRSRQRAGMAQVQLIKRNRFRPRATEGRFIDTSPILVRYYLHE